jgi:hypothetical protein
MAEPLSDENAEAFAKALVISGGNLSKAAIACGYEPGGAARSAGVFLSRHPAVLKCLHPLVMQQLSSLQPRAVQTLAGLLTNKSGYIRLEAAKDILNRMGVGASRDAGNTSPLLISIQIGEGAAGRSVAVVAPEIVSDLDAVTGPGGPKTARPELTRSPEHDFSEKVEAESVSKVLDIEPSEEEPPFLDWEL